MGENSRHARNTKRPWMPAGIDGCLREARGSHRGKRGRRDPGGPPRRNLQGEFLGRGPPGRRPGKDNYLKDGMERRGPHGPNFPMGPYPGAMPEWKRHAHDDWSPTTAQADSRGPMGRELWRNEHLGPWEDYVKFHPSDRRPRRGGGRGMGSRGPKPHMFSNSMDRSLVNMDVGALDIERSRSVPSVGAFCADLRQPSHGDDLGHAVSLKSGSPVAGKGWGDVQLEPRLLLPGQKDGEAVVCDVKLEPRGSEDLDQGCGEVWDGSDGQGKRQRKLGFGDSISKKQPGSKQNEDGSASPGASPQEAQAEGSTADEDAEPLAQEPAVAQEKAKQIADKMEKLEKELDELERAITENKRVEHERSQAVEKIGKGLKNIENETIADGADWASSSEGAGGLEDAEADRLSGSCGTSCESRSLLSPHLQELSKPGTVEGPNKDTDGPAEPEIQPSVAERTVSMEQSTDRSPLPPSGQHLDTASLASDPELSTTEQHLGHLAPSSSSGLFEDNRCVDIVKQNMATAKEARRGAKSTLPTGFVKPDWGPMLPCPLPPSSHELLALARIVRVRQNRREATEASLQEDYSRRADEFRLFMEREVTGTGELLGPKKPGRGSFRPKSQYEEAKIMREIMGKKELAEMCQMPESCTGTWDHGRIFVDKNRLVEDPEAQLLEEDNCNPWSADEKKVFMDKFIEHPKDFRTVASFLEHRTTADCIGFYYQNQKLEVFERVRLKQQLKKRRSTADARKFSIQHMLPPSQRPRPAAVSQPSPRTRPKRTIAQQPQQQAQQQLPQQQQRRTCRPDALPRGRMQFRFGEKARSFLVGGPGDSKGQAMVEYEGFEEVAGRDEGVGSKARGAPKEDIAEGGLGRQAANPVLEALDRTLNAEPVQELTCAQRRTLHKEDVVTHPPLFKREGPVEHRTVDESLQESEDPRFGRSAVGQLHLDGFVEHPGPHSGLQGSFPLFGPPPKAAGQGSPPNSAAPPTYVDPQLLSSMFGASNSLALPTFLPSGDLAGMVPHGAENAAASANAQTLPTMEAAPMPSALSSTPPLFGVSFPKSGAGNTNAPPVCGQDHGLDEPSNVQTSTGHGGKGYPRMGMAASSRGSTEAKTGQGGVATVTPQVLSLVQDVLRRAMSQGATHSGAQPESTMNVFQLLTDLNHLARLKGGSLGPASPQPQAPSPSPPPLFLPRSSMPSSVPTHPDQPAAHAPWGVAQSSGSTANPVNVHGQQLAQSGVGGPGAEGLRSADGTALFGSSWQQMLGVLGATGGVRDAANEVLSRAAASGAVSQQWPVAEVGWAAHGWQGDARLGLFGPGVLHGGGEGRCGGAEGSLGHDNQPFEGGSS
eukprot:evm.model.scf_2250.1 EVM.evm.TU.scf_2250.1   scf_2250:9588-23612(-)